MLPTNTAAGLLAGARGGLQDSCAQQPKWGRDQQGQQEEQSNGTARINNQEKCLAESWDQARLGPLRAADSSSLWKGTGITSTPAIYITTRPGRAQENAAGASLPCGYKLPWFGEASPEAPWGCGIPWAELLAGCAEDRPSCGLGSALAIGTRGPQGSKEKSFPCPRGTGLCGSGWELHCSEPAARGL